VTRISDLPAHDRPRERLDRLGVEALAERELLALVLGGGRRGESAVDVATELLGAFGGLAQLARARPEELRRRGGIGAARAAALVAAFRLGMLAVEAPDDAPVLRRPEDAARIAMRELAGLRRERVIVLVCDSGNRLRHVVTVAEGPIDRAPFPVREILNAVLRHDGKAFVVAHNHPGALLGAGPADQAATATVFAAAQTNRLRFLGHITVGGGTWEEVKSPRTQRLARTVRAPSRPSADGC
jgi:DNA repair protein RadC